MSITPQIDMDVQARDWSRARNDVLNLIHQKPANAKAYYFLAQIDVRMGNVGEARDALAKANNIDPARTFVGNFNAYNKLSGYLNASQQVATVHQAPVAYTATSSKTPTWAWVVGGAAIAMLIIVIVVMVRNAMGRSEERLRDEAQREREAFLRGRSYARDGVRETGFVHNRSTEAVERPQSRYYSPSPVFATPAPQQTVVHTDGGGNDMLTGILVGEMLSDRGGSRVVERDYYHDSPAPSPSPSFDMGSSSSGGSDFGGFDFGSSSGGSDFSGGGDW